MALITGAGQGIGAAIAGRLAAQANVVAIADVDGQSARTVADQIETAGGRARAFTVDVRDYAQIEQVVDQVVHEFGQLDTVVNNAGVNAYFDARTMTDAQWTNVFDVDLKAMWLVCKAALPFLIAQPTPSVVNISSIHAQVTSANMFPYAAAKAAVEGLTRSLALDFGPQGVRVNAVAPGWTETRLVNEWLQRQPDPKQARQRILDAHPLGYIAEPDDVAAVVAFLASTQARAVTGAVFTVDCGLSAGFRI